MNNHHTLPSFTVVWLAIAFMIVGAHNGAATAAPVVADGRHDFDWDIGAWNVHQKRLLHPLSGSKRWIEYSGTDVVQKIWDGANSGIVRSDGTAGHLEIYTLRLYDPDAKHWNIYFANHAGGAVTTPVVGAFTRGSGEFVDHETYRGKPIMVRFRVYDVKNDSCTFDQSFSADSGKTWEVNFVALEARQR